MFPENPKAKIEKYQEMDIMLYQDHHGRWNIRE
jgi:hypothetical protein